MTTSDKGTFDLIVGASSTIGLSLHLNNFGGTLCISILFLLFFFFLTGTEDLLHVLYVVAAELLSAYGLHL